MEEIFPSFKPCIAPRLMARNRKFEQSIIRDPNLVQPSIRGHGRVQHEGVPPLPVVRDGQAGVVHEQEVVLQPVHRGLQQSINRLVYE